MPSFVVVVNVAVFDFVFFLLLVYPCALGKNNECSFCFNGLLVVVLRQQSI